MRHNACSSAGLGSCKITVTIDGKEVYNQAYFKKDYKKVKNKKALYDDLVMNIKENMFNITNNHEILVQLFGDKTVKKNWDYDGFILLPDNCDGNIGNIYHQYFDNELFI